MKEEKEEKVKPLFLFLFFILPAMGLLAMIVGLVSLAIEKRESQTMFFHGVECIHDCSGHISGFQWSKRKKIINSNNCTGNSQSFIEGCKIYVKELK